MEASEDNGTTQWQHNNRILFQCGGRHWAGEVLWAVCLKWSWRHGLPGQEGKHWIDSRLARLDIVFTPGRRFRQDVAASTNSPHLKKPSAETSRIRQSGKPRRTDRGAYNGRGEVSPDGKIARWTRTKIGF